MKKFIITAILAIASVSAFAQTQWYQASSFASKSAYDYDWSDWEPSTVKMCFNLSNDVITIYSPTTQVYQVVTIMEPPYDPTGTQVKFYVINQYGYYGYVRLRMEDNGNSQVYVDFGDGSIVYNVKRIR